MPPETFPTEPQEIISAHRAEDEFASGAAHDLSPLTAPPAVHLAAVLLLFELPAGVEVVALPADEHLQQRVHESVVLLVEGAAQVVPASGAVDLRVLHRVLTWTESLFSRFISFGD